MERAYILIETEVGHAAQVARRAARQDGVRYAELVTGPYDVVAVAEAHSIAELHSGPFTRIDADLRVTRAVMCPIGHLPRRETPGSVGPEPFAISEPEPVLIGAEPDGR
jgi:hypothetical protein